MIGMVNKDKSFRMLTVAEVARMLHIHTNTLRRWADQGLIKSYRITSRGDRRFKDLDVIDFLNKQNNGFNDNHQNDQGGSSLF
jgi:excisionase family DNA binding protein